MSCQSEVSRMPVTNASISRPRGVIEAHEGPLVVPRRRGGAGRAALGGLLVVASAVGVLAGWQGDTGVGAAYVVLTDDVVPGQRLSAEELTRVRIDLPAGQRHVAFTDLDVLIGTVVLGGMRAGQLVQSGDVAAVSGDDRRVEVSIAVDPGSAMNGDRRFLRPGERVDVYVTASVDGTPATRRVATDAQVIDVLAGDGQRLGNGGPLTVVLAVADGEVAAVAGAAVVGKVALARTTGAAR